MTVDEEEAILILRVLVERGEEEACREDRLKPREGRLLLLRWCWRRRGKS
jgi:hypothetical protein